MALFHENAGEVVVYSINWKKNPHARAAELKPVIPLTRSGS